MASKLWRSKVSFGVSQCMLASADLYLDLVWNTCIARDMDELVRMLWNTAHDEYGQYLLWFSFTTATTTLLRLLVLLRGFASCVCLARRAHGGARSDTKDLELEMNIVGGSALSDI